MDAKLLDNLVLMKGPVSHCQMNHLTTLAYALVISKGRTAKVSEYCNTISVFCICKTIKKQGERKREEGRKGERGREGGKKGERERERKREREREKRERVKREKEDKNVKEKAE